MEIYKKLNFKIKAISVKRGWLEFDSKDDLKISF